MQFPWLKRDDLVAVPHDSGGWIVKDPLTLQYTHLDDIEYSVLDLMDGRISIGKMLERARQLCPERRLSLDDLGQFVRVLAGHELIRQSGGGDSVRLNPQATSTSILRLVSPLFRILRLQCRLLNPSRLLDAAMPLVSTFYKPAVVRTMMVVGLLSIMVVGLRFGELLRALPSMAEFLGPQNMVLMLLVFVIVKVLHEAGHAFTARHFGAECNECGIMLMVFTPVLYTNVSDAWLLPRRQRMLITAAGILVELSIASMFALLWSYAAPGTTRALLLNTVVLCSVNTIVFNGNPLLKFDGYFLLADWVGIPNLASRASAVTQETLLNLVTGRSSVSVEPARFHRFLLGYGLASAAYRVLLTLAILKLVQVMSHEWHVQFLGTFLSAVILTGFIIIPATTFLFRVFDHDDSGPLSWIRLTISTVVLLGIALFPLPHSVIAPAFVEPASGPVYATLPGRLDPVARYGDHVKSGSVLANLLNIDLEHSEQNLRGRLNEIRLQLDSLKKNPATANSDLIPALRESRTAAEKRLTEFLSESASLVIRTPTDGVFLPPPAVPKQNDPLPEHWHGTAVQDRNTGAWIQRGTLLGYVGTLADLTVSAGVSEDDVEFITKGQRVEFLLQAGSASSVSAVVESVERLAAKSLPAQWAVAGLASGQPTEEGLLPNAVTYFVRIRLDDCAGAPPPLYSVGRVRIHTRSASLLQRFLRYLRLTF
ncbi:MAG: M50 family metallopeptidase [Fuerstiella sp.]|nr:M50 family metallopeptidase [Fuerstiella sp.]